MSQVQQRSLRGFPPKILFLIMSFMVCWQTESIHRFIGKSVFLHDFHHNRYCKCHFLICADVVISKIQCFEILLPNECVIVRSLCKIRRAQEWPGCHPTWNSHQAWQHCTFCTQWSLISVVIYLIFALTVWVRVCDLKPFPWLCIMMLCFVNPDYLDFI